MKRKLRALLRDWKIGRVEALVRGIVIIGLAFVLLGPFLRLGEKHVVFDAAQWQAEDTGCSFYRASKRQQMSKDLARVLLQTRPRPGKREVAQLLGEPDLYKTQEVWAYRAGADFMDCLSFDVGFDPNGAVASASLVQH